MAETKTVRISMQWTKKKSFLVSVPADMGNLAIEDMVFDCEEEFYDRDRFDHYPVDFDYDENTISIMKICSDEESYNGASTRVEEPSDG
ncbi:MAG: hypothetical protein AB7E51_00340 [Pseudodesulfovibrio sp.]|uniref:hypothetical protein n=1 Tax=Pseudodesulfovibrio sp. TaxID=2035812 RepID=UPI003D10EBF3